MTAPECQDFITGALVPNPQWRYSGLLGQDQVMRYLKGEATLQDARAVIGYILIYQENLSLTAYLFSKATSVKEAEESKEYNLPVLKKIRALAALASTDKIDRLNQIAHEMENLCLEVGADPL